MWSCWQTSSLNLTSSSRLPAGKAFPDRDLSSYRSSGRTPTRLSWQLHEHPPEDTGMRTVLLRTSAWGTPEFLRSGECRPETVLMRVVLQGQSLPPDPTGSSIYVFASPSLSQLDIAVSESAEITIDSNATQISWRFW